jgi:hypothetical protein
MLVWSHLIISIVKPEWPALSAFTAWLDRSNFDALGRQGRRLEGCRSACDPTTTDKRALFSF